MTPLPTLAHRVRSPGDWRPSSGGSSRRTPPKRTKRSLRTWVSWVLLLCVALLIVGALSTVAVFAWVSRDLPDPNKINDRFVAQSTRIYDRTGEHVLYEIHGDEKRTVVGLENIAETARQATIAAEDRDFYQHKGFDLKGILRSVVKNIIHLDPTGQGGSTITQQFIKNSILTSEKSYIRKIKEVVLAYQLEKRFSKDDILKLYLNEIPYGSNAYGIEAAAQNFFGVPAKDLTLAQSAVLAALPRATTYYSPYGNNTDELFARQQLILDAMAEEGFITTDEAAAAKAEKLTFRQQREGITAPHFVFYVRELLTEKYGEETVEQGGLKVITTLDLKHQEAAEKAIADQGPKNEERWGATNAAMVSLDTKTGQVLAMVGSRDYFNIERDGNVNVTLRPRQPGSSFKPFVYEAAFERGYTPETMVFDLETNFDTGSKPYTPHNYDGGYRGPISLRRALAGSLNIPAVQVLYLAGVNTVLDNADRLGYTTLKDRSRFGLSLVLGGAEVKLLEHTAAYAALAREGVRHPTTPILRVENRNGKVLEQYEKKEIRVLDEVAVRKINDILTDNNARSYIFGSRNFLTLPDRLVAAKTGTTNDYRDAWTLGFTPSLAAGFWVGKNDNTEMKRGADGSVIAAPMWQAYMKSVLAGTPVETFKKPPENDAKKPILRGEIDVLHEYPVDRLTGKVIPESCRDTYPKQFVTMKGFKETHTILHWVKKEDPRGEEPKNPGADPQYTAWERAVHDWAKKRDYPDLTKLPQERCDRRDANAAPVVTITSPEENAILTTATTEFSVAITSTETVARVAFEIDGQSIGNDQDPPFSVLYSNTRFANGEHVLKVTATDDAGNVGEATLTFSYAVPNEAAFLQFISPQQNAVYAADDFPITVTVTAYHPSGINRLELLENGIQLDAKERPVGGTITLSVANLEPGTKTLVLRLLPTNGEATTTTRTVTIQEAVSGGGL